MKKIFPLSLILCGFVFALTACASPYPKTFPDEWKEKEFLESEHIVLSDGVNYYHYIIKDFFGENHPFSFYAVIVDWDRAKVRLNLEQSGLFLSTVENMVKTKAPVFAVNGAYFFFTPPSTYFRLKINGKIYEPGIDIKGRRGGLYASGLAFSGADFPVIINKTSDADFEKYDNVIQGYMLAADGISKYAKRDRSKDKHDTPYTAVGINKTKREVIFFVCDGRHGENAPGIDFRAIPDFLIAIGAEDVISIDGGGSSTMLIRKENALKLVNRPSDNKTFDHAGARMVHNCIYVTKD